MRKHAPSPLSLSRFLLLQTDALYTQSHCIIFRALGDNYGYYRIDSRERERETRERSALRGYPWYLRIGVELLPSLLPVLLPLSFFIHEVRTGYFVCVEGSAGSPFFLHCITRINRLLLAGETGLSFSGHGVLFMGTLIMPVFGEVTKWLFRVSWVSECMSFLGHFIRWNLTGFNFMGFYDSSSKARVVLKARVDSEARFSGSKSRKLLPACEPWGLDRLE